MIVFHRDHLVQPELCQLLYQIVPLEYHCPMVFTNKCNSLGNGQPEASHDLGYRWQTNEPGEGFIAVNLNRIYGQGMMENLGSSEFRIWKSLLWTCLHEFGHVATEKDVDYVSKEAYEDEWSREHDRVEYLADRWRNRTVWELAGRDKRLGQPRTIKGYLGDRLAYRSELRRKHGPCYWPEIARDARCYLTGMQLSSGEVLSELGLWGVRNGYATLRRVSGNLGRIHIDAAGRHHRLYLYSELPLLARRFALAKQQVQLPSVDEFRPGTWGYAFSKARTAENAPIG